jgi:hypothetical protein
MNNVKITNKPQKVKNTEIQKNKMADEATNAAKLVIHKEMKRMLADHEKDMKEQMAEQSRKHAV